MPPSSPSDTIILERLKAGLRLQQQGRVDLAEPIYRSVLAIEPDNFDALHLLGVCRSLQNDDVGALDFLSRALALDPKHPDALFNCARLLRKMGRLEEALGRCTELIALSPAYRNALTLRAELQLLLGRNAEALSGFDAALRANPLDVSARLGRIDALSALGRLSDALDESRRASGLHPRNAAVLLQLAGLLQRELRHGEALEAYSRVLALTPQDVPAMLGRAECAVALGRDTEAQNLAAGILEIEPDNAGAHAIMARIFTALGQHARALESFDRILAAVPGDYEAMVQRARVLRSLGRIDEATLFLESSVASLEKRRAADPAPSTAGERSRLAADHNVRAMLLTELGRVDEALRALEEAIALAADEPMLHNNKANALCVVNEVEAAIASYDRALALAPGLEQAKWNRSLALLRSGDYERGFAAYEARFAGMPGQTARQFQGTEWRPGDLIAGKRLLLYAEQGFGDAIQFARFAPLLAQKGARVHLCVHPELVELCRSLGEEISVSAMGERLPEYDLHCPLLSVPHRLGLTLATVPSATPYLRVDAAKVEAWRERLRQIEGARKVGLVWSGRPAHVDDSNRSIPLRAFAEVLASPGTAFVSLQQKLGNDDREAASRFANFVHWPDELKTFSDTAALIEALDLVISVDTAVAHLAGALGKPVWILLPLCPDWRWLTERDDSPWYPTATLFRQTRFRDWRGVLSAVGERLRRPV